MPVRIEWTEAADAQLLELRRARRTWDEIAAAAGVSRNAAIDRGKRLLIAQGSPEEAAARLPRARAAREAAPREESGPPSFDERPPLPAFDPLAWAAICTGTALADAPPPRFGEWGRLA
jgi:hypothetical protein